MANTTEVTTDPTEKKPTTFEDLPAELRNRIYHESGCLQYLEPDQTDRGFRNTFRGDYTVQSHAHVHWCTAGSSCANAIWRNHRATSVPALILVNGRDPPRSASSLWTHQYITQTPCLQRLWPPACHIFSHDATIAQPELTRVSRMVRADTLPIFYGGHTFVFRLMAKDVQVDAADIIRFFDTIGPTNAGRLKDVVIVYGKKKALRFIVRVLLPELRRRGLDGEYADVRCVKTGYPFDHADADVLRTAREKR